MIVVACSIAGFVVGGIVMLPPMLIRNAFGSFSYGKNYAMANVVLYIFAGNKSEISLNLPLLWVPIKILSILYMHLEIK